MISDILTIIWKEWKEIFLRRGGARSGMLNLVIILGLLGVFMPLQGGREWLTNPVFPLLWSWLPIFMAINIVADAFAGERERHTLETLLASRLSDQAILLGKIGAAVFYAWGITLIGMLLGAITVNVAFPGGAVFYTGLTFPLGLLLSFLAALLVASAGTLISLNAPTARSAYQRLSIVIMAIWLLPSLALQFIPANTRASLFSGLQGVDVMAVLSGVLVVLALADVALVLVSMARFKRARLILE